MTRAFVTRREHRRIVDVTLTRCALELVPFPENIEVISGVVLIVLIVYFL